MKRLLVSSIIILAGCAVNTGVVPVGQDTFMVSRQAATGFSGLGDLRGEAFREAHQYCLDQRKSVQVIHASESSPPYIFGNFPKAVVQFKCLDANDSELKRPSIVETEDSSGTGFFVTQDVVATNYHVVREAKQISLSIGGTAVGADLLLKDAQNDLALLRVNSANLPTTVRELKGVKCLAMGNSDAARSGDAVFTIGFPLSGILAATPSVAQGLISNSSGIDNDPRMFQISIPIQAGNSGSPLLDSYGRVIGVVTSTLSSRAMLKATGSLPQNVNFATKSSYLRSILSMAPSSDCAESALFKQPLTARDMHDHYASSVVPIRVSR